MSDHIHNLLLLTTGMFLAAVALPVLLTISDAPAAGQPAESITPHKLVMQMQDKYHDLTSLTFDFSQVTRGGGHERHGMGSAVFLRPAAEKNQTTPNLPQAIMRWNYTEPGEQVILNDGKELSIYTARDRQLIITPAEQLNSDITYAFLSGTRNLLDDFKPLPPAPRFTFTLSDQSLQALRLVPRKPHPQVKEIQLWIDRDFLIRHLLIEDHFDSVTELTFSNIRLNSIAANDRQEIQKIIDLKLALGTEIITR